MFDVFKNLKKEIDSEVEKRTAGITQYLIAMSVSYIVGFLHWKGLVGENDFDEYMDYLVRKVKQDADFRWLKKVLEEIREKP